MTPTHPSASRMWFSIYMIVSISDAALPGLASALCLDLIAMKTRYYYPIRSATFQCHIQASITVKPCLVHAITINTRPQDQGKTVPC